MRRRPEPFLGRRRIDLTLARDRELAATKAVVEADEVEDRRRARHELGSESSKRCAETSGGAGARKPGVRQKLVHAGESALEDRDVILRRALLRAEHASRVRKRRRHVDERGRRNRELAQDLPQTGTSVNGRASTETDEKRPWLLVQCR